MVKQKQFEGLQALVIKLSEKIAKLEEQIKNRKRIFPGDD